MARINNFASALKVAVYRANNHYSPTNPPMTADNVYDFTDQWNQAKVRGTLYGNIKQRDYIKEKPIELKDVVLF